MDNESKKQLLDVTQKIILDADLGKLEGKKVDVSINIRNQKANLPQNIMVFQAFAYLAAIKLKPSTNRVLMYFFALSAYENYIGIDVETLCEKLDLSKRQTLRALDELEKNNIIIRIQNPRDKRRNDYFINPMAAWKGNSFSRNKTISKMYDKRQLKLFPTNLD